MLAWFVTLATTAPVLAQPFGQAGGTPQVPVYIDDSPTARQLAKQADRLIEQDRVVEALRALQTVIERYPYKLMPRAERLHVDALVHVRQRITGNPALLDAYRRQFEPAAKRALDQATANGNDLDALASVAQRFGPCSAGLEASLRLAGLLLESADPTAAAAVLDAVATHPDIKSHAARWHWLQSVAGLYASDADRLARHTQALRQLPDGQEQVELIQAWQQRSARGGTLQVLDPMRPLPDAQPPDLSEPARWTFDFGTAPTGRPDIGLGRSRRTGSTERHPIIPVVAGDRLYLNDSRNIVALDRNSRFVVWRFDGTAATASDTPLGRRGSSQGGVEARGVAVGGARVVAVIGNLPATAFGGWGGVSVSSKLVSLDRDSGKPLWSIDPGDIDKSLNNAFFHGTPIVDRGRVYALIRRSAIANFQDAYAVCVDLADGKTKWRRYLSSSIASNTVSNGTLSAMVFDHGRLYVADRLGAVACIAGHDGRMLWLRQTHDAAKKVNPIGVGAFQVQSSWTALLPARTPAGLVLPPQSSGDKALLLDTDTGEVVRELEGAHWQQASSLMPVGDDLLCMGMTVTLIDGKTFKPKWQRQLNTEERQTIDGRAAVTPTRILLPTHDRILVLDTATGKTLGRHDVAKAGNVLLVEGQVITAGGSQVRSYMDWARVRANLTRLIRDHPLDPTRGLALAEAAFRADEPDAAIDAIDESLKALHRRLQAVDPNDPQDEKAAGVTRQNVFDTLLAFAEQKRARSPQLRQLIFDRLGQSTATPKHDVAYQLALGRFLEETGESIRAADHFQAVLSDPDLANQLYERAEGTRRAGLEAKMRLAALIKAHGARVYAKHESAAADELVAQKFSPRPNVKRLEQLAERYPLSRTAPSALLMAADALAAENQHEHAIAQLRQAYRHMSELRRIYDNDSQNALAQRVVGKLATWYVKLDQPWRARHWLRRLKREYEGIDPLRDGRPVPVDEWLSQLNETAARPGGLPSFRWPIGSVHVLPGTLMTPTRQAPQSWPTDRFVTRSAEAIQLRAADTMRTRWQIVVPKDVAELLAVNDEQVLVWFADAGVLRAVDSATGKTQWRVPAVAELLDEAGRAVADQPINPRIQANLLQPGGLREGVARVNGRIVDNNNPFGNNGDAVFFEVGETIVLVADSRGRAIGLDRQTGQVLWKRLFAGQRLTRVHLGDEAVVLAGTTTPDAEGERSAIMALDPLTGESICRTIGARNPVEWVGIGGNRLIIYATGTLGSAQLVAHHVGDQRDAWRVPLVNGASVVGWSNHDLLAIRDDEGRIALVDPATGQFAGELSKMGERHDTSMDLRIVEGVWHMQSRHRAVAVAADGAKLWRDGLGDLPKNIQTQLVGEQYVVLLSLAEEEGRRRAADLADRLGGNPALLPLLRGQPGRNGAHAWYYRLSLLDRQTGLVVHERVIGPLADVFSPTHAWFCNDRLILSTTGATVVLNGSSAAP